MSHKIDIQNLADLPVAPVTISSMAWHQTGCWRYLTPAAQDKSAPCHMDCPSQVSIPQFIDSLGRDDPDAALEAILKSNPFPGITGRICYHPCQTGCLRRKVDRNIPIQHLERWAADSGRVTPKAASGGPAIAVVGAGPAGLSCAYFLGRSGCSVTVFDPFEKAGGFLLDVPAKRLPPSVLQQEVDRLQDLAGIRMVLNHSLTERSDLHKAFALVIVDATAYSEESRAARVLMDFLANGQSSSIEKAMAIQGSGLKPSHIAHAIGLGRETAIEALKKVAPDRIVYGVPAPAKTDGPRVREDDLPLERFAPAPPVDATKPLDLKTEAARCLSCGTCNLCRLCEQSCPDACISASAGKITIDLAYCKGCGICAHECPRSVITMESHP